MRTMYLNPNTWRPELDASGNIKWLDDEDMAIAQDVASAARCFKGEAYFNVPKGVRYFRDVLGKLPAASLIASAIEEAARKVPGVKTATVVFYELENRTLKGEIQIKTISGSAFNVNF